MKKIIALTGLFLLAASSAFAAAAATGATTANTEEGYTLQATAPATTNIAKTSKGVRIAWNTTTTGYSLATYHMNGTKQFGTAYDSTAIMVKDVGTGATLAAPSSSVSAEAFPTSGGWSAM